MLLQQPLHPQRQVAAHLPGLLSNQNPERLGLVSGHNQAEPLTQYPLNPAQRHLAGIPGVGVEHGERLAGVEDQPDWVEVSRAEEEVVAD